MIDDRDIARLKEIFVTRQECQATTDAIESKLSKDMVRLAVMETELKQIKWLVGAVLAVVITNLANSLFSVIK